MELNTPQAVRQIKSCSKDYAVVEGEKQSLLQAMSFALKFHKLNLIDQNGELFVRGTVPVNNSEPPSGLAEPPRKTSWRSS
ncbi:hypothetical protein SG34_003940 [Thalassomonas viridans]|uniref:Uncharacterized protein n=1 Tax=Thalassomonas viridans TaxID=137584 RepID=A0AAF0CAA4_9GAMM|nr:hypothetical protein [Thalassomonas viridans]WDE06090.1 hypothetical protein SG34_003940 [Thalassomonas viridans]